MPLKNDPISWETGSRIAIIRDALTTGTEHVPGVDSSGKSKCPECKRAARSLYDRVGVEPLIYKTKVNGVMTPLPQGKERWRRFSNEVREVHDYIVKGDFGGTSEPASEPTPEPAPVTPIRPTGPKGTKESELRARVEELYRDVNQNRAFVRVRKMESLDSMRIMIDGTRAVLRGVPVKALISSIQAPWSAETRLQAQNFRATPDQLRPILPEGTYDYSSFAPRPSEFAHATAGYALPLVEAGIPVWAHGPAGTGKSSIAHYCAEVLGLDYYEVNLAGAMVSAVKGKDRLKEFVESDAMRAYEHGGLLCLEEFDSAHPTVGTALNTMLAGDEYHNDADGRTIKRHPNFRVIVTANSLGYGSAEFKRQDLDGATKDRFRMGRIYMGLDMELERRIVDSIVDAFFASEAVAA